MNWHSNDFNRVSFISETVTYISPRCCIFWASIICIFCFSIMLLFLFTFLIIHGFGLDKEGFSSKFTAKSSTTSHFNISYFWTRSTIERAKNNPRGKIPKTKLLNLKEIIIWDIKRIKWITKKFSMYVSIW